MHHAAIRAATRELCHAAIMPLAMMPADQLRCAMLLIYYLFFDALIYHASGRIRSYAATLRRHADAADYLRADAR